MAGTITHEWNGTVLTITSDSGTSSADLKGSIGDIGPRGPQGPAGVIIESDGSINMNGYATEQYVNDKIAGVVAGDINFDNYYTKAEVDAKIDDIETGGGSDVDLSNYYTKTETETYVSGKIAEAQLSGEGGSVDLSAYALKTDIPDVSNYVTMAQVEAKGYQTADQVQTAINEALAALDGDEVTY